MTLNNSIEKASWTRFCFLLGVSVFLGSCSTKKSDDPERTPSSRNRATKTYPYLVSCQSLKEVRYLSTYVSNFVIYPDRSSELTLVYPQKKGIQRKQNFETLTPLDLREFSIADNEQIRNFNVFIRDVQPHRNSSSLFTANADVRFEFRSSRSKDLSLSQSLDCVVTRSFMPDLPQNPEDVYEP